VGELLRKADLVRENILQNRRLLSACEFFHKSNLTVMPLAGHRREA